MYEVLRYTIWHWPDKAFKIPHSVNCVQLSLTQLSIILSPYTPAKLNYLQFPHTLCSPGLWTFLPMLGSPPQMPILKYFPSPYPLLHRVILDSPPLTPLQPHSLSLSLKSHGFLSIPPYSTQVYNTYNLIPVSYFLKRPSGLESYVYTDYILFTLSYACFSTLHRTGTKQISKKF